MEIHVSTEVSQTRCDMVVRAGSLDNEIFRLKLTKELADQLRLVLGIYDACYGVRQEVKDEH